MIISPIIITTIAIDDISVVSLRRYTITAFPIDVTHARFISDSIGPDHRLLILRKYLHPRSRSR